MHAASHPTRLYFTSANGGFQAGNFVADEFGHGDVVRVAALVNERQRILPAPFEFVADWADPFHVPVRTAFALKEVR